MKSYRSGLDKQVEKSYEKLLEISSHCRFRKCPKMEGFSYYYAEERMYLIRNDYTGTLSIVFGGSPDAAVQEIMKTEQQ